MTTEALHPIAISAQARGTDRRRAWIFFLFFCSGFPALIYQIVWQRALFSIYGINIQAVTIDVSAFMLGLGVGSLVGGAISRVRGVSLVAWFGLAELGAATFGFFSLKLFHLIAGLTLHASIVDTALVTFSLVLVPTILMGATLPLLVEQLVRLEGNVGVSVGGLYFVNTLGSGAACFLASTWLMRSLGQSGSVQFAASINVCVALGSLILAFTARNWRPNASTPTDPGEHNGHSADALLSLKLAFACAAFGGFAALSYEIMWYRLLAFALADTAPVFASLLGAYLFGIALGSRFTERYSRTHAGRIAVRSLSTILLASGTVAFMVGPASALLMRNGSPLVLQSNWPINLVFLIMICIAASLFGATLPLIAHVSIAPQERAGACLSYLYAANILGSTLGTLLVGFVLMDRFSLFQVSLTLLLGSFLFAAAVAVASAPRGVGFRGSFVGGVAFSLVLAIAVRPFFQTMYDRLLFKREYPRLHFQTVVQNRGGTVCVTPEGTVIGGGVYDGRFSIDLLHDVNMIARPYALSAFHPAPRRVLMIGLGSGSWGQVLANHPQIEQLTIVEINPGYLQLITKHRMVASLLQNHKVNIVIDDGRRWLLRNPQEKFDAVVMNTSFYWRNHSSNLLSVEFLQIVRQHLAPGGVFFYNTTNSDDVIATALSVYPYALRVLNAVAVSDSALIFDRNRWKSILLTYVIDGTKVIDTNDPSQLKRLYELVNIQDSPPGRDWNSIESNEELRQRLRDHLVITDDNMGLEWRQPK